ncbi:MAG: MBL fold metallo-hydrolase [Candidatus Diapherotrites archaeon CG08_land_8_20_14_0_20_30_16]|nr:MAG: MBL fold metallo-hydrolase [Candidatus Diapherotrites archaeon CG08_land_8_20_14_0_20_30_16]
MELIILGSGGCQPIPRPCCECKVCKEARIKGVPYSRDGPALFLNDINALFDTPEEIGLELNRERIKKINLVFYTHWHPDHTAGMRVFEQLNLDWLNKSIGKSPKYCVPVYANKIVWDELNALKNKFGSYFDYYKSQKLIIKKCLKNNVPVKLNNLEITGVFRSAAGCSDNVLIYVIKEKKKKVIYAPCDCKPFPDSKLFLNSDILIIWAPFFEGYLKDKFKLEKDNPIRKELFSMAEIIAIIEKIKPKKTIITHIEELMGKSYADFKKLEKVYKKYNIQFAYDGLKIKL